MSAGDADEQHWPNKGQTLFCSGKDYHNNACLNWGTDNFQVMCSGYLLGAELLVDSVVDSGRNQDLLVYPIIFQYRHYVELRLKELIDLGRGLTGETGKDPWGHSLLALWRKARPLLERIETGSPKEDLNAVEEVILQFEKFDGTGESFRYWKDSNERNPLASLNHINLRILRDVMKGITAFFEGASIQFSVYLDQKREAESEDRQAELEVQREYESEMRADWERDAR
jgi:hypothetical protein